MPVLRIVDGHGAGFSVQLEGEAITIGRDVTCSIQIGDPKASRIHAEVIYQNATWVVRDRGSSNGTWNDQGPIETWELKNGHTFRIGRTYLRFDEETEINDGVDQSKTMVGDDGVWDEPEIISGLGSAASELFSLHDRDPDQVERANAYLVMLHKVVTRSHAADSREALFEILDDVAADLLDGDRCAVFLPSDDGWRLWPVHERRLRARFGTTPFANGLLSASRTRQEPLLCTNDGDLDPTVSMAQFGISSGMTAPLRIGESVMALLYVDRLEDGAAFTRTDLELLAAIANQLAVQLHNMDQVADLTAEVERLSQEQPNQRSVELIGADPAMDKVHTMISKAGPSPAPVLVTGESGTGKELVARALYEASKRADKPLQTVNCAAMAESLVEATLFGHVKGAFTGAESDRAGLFELADGGTLFLDEVGELPVSMQAKLLRVLEQGEVQRVGENLTRKVDVRLIAATNRDLNEEVTAGRFREDLLHRLNVIEIELPPLRERPGDIDRLIDHFLRRSASRLDVPVPKLEPQARALLLAHPWPGNVRQLRNVIERAAIMAGDHPISTDDLPESLHDASSQTGAVVTPLVGLSDVEKAHILRVLDHTGGNKKAAAELLGIDRSTLYAKLRQYGVHS